MAWGIFKTVCRIYAAIMSGIVMFQLVGMALAGGLRITPSDVGPMSPSTGATLFFWCVAIIVTCLTKEEA